MVKKGWVRYTQAGYVIPSKSGYVIPRVVLMKIQVEAWRCDVCEYVWLKVAGRVPERCPARACRSRKWNSGVTNVSETLLRNQRGEVIGMEMVQEMPLAEARRRYPESSLEEPGRRTLGGTEIVEDRSIDKLNQQLKLEDIDELQRLRQIAKGDIAALRLEDIDPDPAGHLGPVPEACPYRELDPEANEWVYCALPVHESKIKHVPGRRESA